MTALELVREGVDQSRAVDQSRPIEWVSPKVMAASMGRRFAEPVGEAVDVHRADVRGAEVEPIRRKKSSAEAAVASPGGHEYGAGHRGRRAGDLDGAARQTQDEHAPVH